MAPRGTTPLTAHACAQSPSTAGALKTPKTPEKHTDQTPAHHTGTPQGQRDTECSAGEQHRNGVVPAVLAQPRVPYTCMQDTLIRCFWIMSGQTGHTPDERNCYLSLAQPEPACHQHTHVDGHRGQTQTLTTTDFCNPSHSWCGWLKGQYNAEHGRRYLLLQSQSQQILSPTIASWLLPHSHTLHAAQQNDPDQNMQCAEDAAMHLGLVVRTCPSNACNFFKRRHKTEHDRCHTTRSCCRGAAHRKSNGEAFATYPATSQQQQQQGS
jgi:hypothetical protein